ncbi:MAG: poly-gamma-glutamate system protein [Bacteroidota bacterium]|nr:poly-gamma-glutamate system protein [Bacteroidota bacterium]
MWTRPDIAKSNKTLIITGIICAVILTGFVLAESFIPKKTDAEKELAIRYMSEMIDAVSDYCRENDIKTEKAADPLETGLIGYEWTAMTTTIGHLEAKRTTLNPVFASLMVTLLREADVETGDIIALGCSGSFPGLLLACLAGAKAMELNCKSIISLGASSFGANRPELTILDIYQILIDNELITDRLVGVSLGGEGDTGQEWDRDIREKLLQKILLSDIPFIREEDLMKNVSQRAELFGFNTDLVPKVFINAGGATANIGISPSILHLKPGVIQAIKLPPPEQQGVLHYALRRNIPVIHLLFIKGLILEYALPWDPVIIQHAE